MWQTTPEQPTIHPHVPSLLAFPDWTPGKDSNAANNKDKEHEHDRPFLQVVLPGEGRNRMVVSNLIGSHCDYIDSNESNRNKKRNWPTRPLCIHYPILVRDTPESIGMEIPRGRTKTKTSSKAKNHTDKRKRPSECIKKSRNDPFSIRDVARVVGIATPVQMIDCSTQRLSSDCEDWTIGHLLEYLEDEQRQELLLTSVKPHPTTTRTTTTITTTKTPPPASPPPKLATSAATSCVVSPSTGRKRRQAALRSEERVANILHTEQPGSGACFSTNHGEQQQLQQHGNFGVAGQFRGKILNQISFEFSGTPLHDMVRSPGLVRAIDWIDNAWPSREKYKTNERGPKETGSTGSRAPGGRTGTAKGNNRKATKGSMDWEYPVVQYYCLTSVSGAYTDFHIDFGGSSVWYHVVSGSKIFCVLPPTDTNLEAFQEWLCLEQQSSVFLPDLVRDRADGNGDGCSETTGRKCYVSGFDRDSFSPDATRDWDRHNTAAFRFLLSEGETLILPAGWIHAVYTPRDSLVFGGNFLHGWDMGMQLKVNKLEAHCGVLDRYRFPHFGALQMYAGGAYLGRLREERASAATKCRRKRNTKAKPRNRNAEAFVSDQELKELSFLINELDYWWALEQDDRGDGYSNKSSKKKSKSTHTRKPTKMANAGNNRDKKDAGFLPNMVLVTSRASFRKAALCVLRETGCKSVEDFLASLREEQEWATNDRLQKQNNL